MERFKTTDADLFEAIAQEVVKQAVQNGPVQYTVGERTVIMEYTSAYHIYVQYSWSRYRTHVSNSNYFEYAWEDFVKLIQDWIAISNGE